MSAAFQFASPSLAERQPIPAASHLRGRRNLPDLAWSAPSEATMSFALLMHDPDAPKAGVV